VGGTSTGFPTSELSNLPICIFEAAVRLRIYLSHFISSSIELLLCAMRLLIEVDKARIGFKGWSCRESGFLLGSAQWLGIFETFMRRIRARPGMNSWSHNSFLLPEFLQGKAPNKGTELTASSVRCALASGSG